MKRFKRLCLEIFVLCGMFGLIYVLAIGLGIEIESTKDFLKLMGITVVVGWALPEGLGYLLGVKKNGKRRD